MDESIVLDPVEFCPDRVELDLHQLGLEVRAEGADWGESAVETQMSRQSIGAVVTDRHLQPVEMSIPLIVRAEGGVPLAEAAHKIQQKLGLYQQEPGGWIRRDFATAGGFAGSVGYQVLTASLSGLDGWLMAHRQVAHEVELKVLRSPLCYALTEDESEVFKQAVGAREVIFELASILGTAPGLIRIRITNDKTADWRGLILAGESRDMAQDATADTTAALAYDAVDLTLKGGSVNMGGFLEHASLGAGWLTILDSEITGVGHMTHKGVRRLWLRARDLGAEAGDVQLKLRWRPLGLLRWSENAIVPSLLAFQWLDMGECRPEQAALGDERWQFQVQARALSGAGKIWIDRVDPLPTEQHIVLKAPVVPGSADNYEPRSPGTVANDASYGEAEWKTPENAKASDDIRASVSLGGGESNYLKATNFGFKLPEGAKARVTGIVVEVERQYNPPESGPDFAVYDGRVLIVKAGSPIGNEHGNSSPWPNGDKSVFYGDSDDTWLHPSQSWEVSEINAVGFGVALTAISSGASTALVDHIRVTVCYTEDTDDNRICFATRSIELRSDGVYRQHPTEDVWGQVVPEGGLPYASPSGLEGRKSRFIAIPTPGDLGELADSGDIALSAQGLTRAGYHVAREAA